MTYKIEIPTAKDLFNMTFGPAINLAYPLPLKYGLTANNHFAYEIAKGYFNYSFYVTIITLDCKKRNDLNKAFISYQDAINYTKLIS